MSIVGNDGNSLSFELSILQLLRMTAKWDLCTYYGSRVIVLLVVLWKPILAWIVGPSCPPLDPPLVLVLLTNKNKFLHFDNLPSLREP